MNEEKQSLVEAYNNTKYCADVDGNELTLIPKTSSPSLDKLLDIANFNCATFITAWNPRSINFDLEKNILRNSKLKEDLGKLKLPYFVGYGVGIDGDWQAEESYLVFGMSKIEAMDLAITYEQNAFAYYQKGKCVEIVLTNLMK